MKKLVSFIMIVLCGAFIFQSCSKTESYADKKKKENAAIQAFITDNNIKVITEDDFAKQGYTTDTAKNEYVLFESNGIYLQIVRKGCGEPLKNGETSDVLVRFDEYNLLEDTLQLTNNVLYYSAIVEKMSVTNAYGTFTGSFDTSSSLMYVAYSSQSVPAAWLYPLTYVNLGRPVEDDDEIAKVRIIVPSAQGQYYASANVYPCYYNLTYERGI